MSDNPISMTPDASGHPQAIDPLATELSRLLHFILEAHFGGYISIPKDAYDRWYERLAGQDVVLNIEFHPMGSDVNADGLPVNPRLFMVMRVIKGDEAVRRRQLAEMPVNGSAN